MNQNFLEIGFYLFNIFHSINSEIYTQKVEPEITLIKYPFLIYLKMILGFYNFGFL